MSRYVIVIRKPNQPQAYYLSKSGLRCYDSRNVAVFKSEKDAVENRDHFAGLMRDFVLAVEVLPPKVRNLAKALLSARPM